MLRTKKTNKLAVRQRKIERVDAIQELRRLKEEELRHAMGGNEPSIVRTNCGD